MRGMISKTKAIYMGRRIGRWIAAGLALACVIGALQMPAAYAAETNQVTLPVSQTLLSDGLSTPPGEAFTYRLTPETASTPLPAGSDSTGYTFTMTGTADTQIAPILFSDKGIYTYGLTCTTTAKTGYTIDRQAYTVTIYITSNSLPIFVAYLSDGDKVSKISFEHAYKTPQNGVTPVTPQPPAQPEAQPPAVTTPTPAPPAQPEVQPPVAITPPLPSAPPVPGLEPTVPVSGHHWSLLSGIMSLAAVLTAALLLVSVYFRKREYETYSDNLENRGLLTDGLRDKLDGRRKKGRVLKAFAILAGVITPVVWLIFDLPLIGVVWIDRWTPWTALAFIITMILTLAFNIRKEHPDQDDEDTEAGGPDPVYMK